MKRVMKRGMLVLLAALSLNVAAADNVEAAKAKMMEYFDAFGKNDLQRIVTEIYAPSVQMVVRAGHQVLPTPEAALAGLTGFRNGLVARGWVEFRFDNMETCEISDNLVLLDTQYASVFKRGSETSEMMSTMLYVLHKIDGEWRIVAYYDHDHDKRPTCG